MRNTSFYLDDRSCQERNLVLTCIYKSSGATGWYERNGFEAWLIAKTEFDHTAMTYTYDYGLEILSRTRRFRFVRPISREMCDIIYWKGNWTKDEKVKYQKFMTAIAEMCDVMRAGCVKFKGKCAAESQREFAMGVVNRMLGEYIDNEVFALETKKK